jgi:multiple sugar transport system permease protein
VRRGQTMRALTTLRVITLLVGAGVMVTPFVYMLSTSFKPQAFVLQNPPQFIPDPFTLNNYVQAWTTQDFARYAMNSVIVAVVSTAVSILVSSMRTPSPASTSGARSSSSGCC